jgi:hypothetical protein
LDACTHHDTRTRLEAHDLTRTRAEAHDESEANDRKLQGASTRDGARLDRDRSMPALA